MENFDWILEAEAGKKIETAMGREKDFLNLGARGVFKMNHTNHNNLRVPMNIISLHKLKSWGKSFTSKLANVATRSEPSSGRWDHRNREIGTINRNDRQGRWKWIQPSGLSQSLRNPEKLSFSNFLGLKSQLITFSFVFIYIGHVRWARCWSNRWAWVMGSL